MKGCGLGCGVDAQLFGQQSTAAVVCAQRLGWISRRRVYAHEQLMRPLPKRFQRDCILSGARCKLVTAPLGVAFAERTQRPQMYFAETVADTIDPSSHRVGKKWTCNDLTGVLGKCYRPRSIAFAQDLLRGFHGETGTLDIETTTSDGKWSW